MWNDISIPDTIATTHLAVPWGQKRPMSEVALRTNQYPWSSPRVKKGWRPLVYITEHEYTCYTSSILTRGRSAELITGRAKSGRHDQTKSEKGRTRCRKLYDNKEAERGERSMGVDTSMRTFLIIRVFGSVVSLFNSFNADENYTSYIKGAPSPETVGQVLLDGMEREETLPRNPWGKRLISIHILYLFEHWKTPRIYSYLSSMIVKNSK